MQHSSCMQSRSTSQWFERAWTQQSTTEFSSKLSGLNKVSILIAYAQFGFIFPFLSFLSQVRVLFSLLAKITYNSSVTNQLAGQNHRFCRLRSSAIDLKAKRWDTNCSQSSHSACIFISYSRSRMIHIWETVSELNNESLRWKQAVVSSSSIYFFVWSFPACSAYVFYIADWMEKQLMVAVSQTMLSSCCL